MANLVLSADDAQLAVGGDHQDYELVHNEIIDEWRWGNIYQSVIKDSEGKLWEVSYRVQSGDNYHHEFEDLGTVEFYPVEAKEVTTVTYVRIKD